MSKWHYFLTLLLSVICVIAVNLVVTRQSLPALSLSNLSEYQCSTGSGRTASLKLQLGIPMSVQAISGYLCHSQIIASHYGSVVVSWTARDAITAADILDQEYVLLMGRQHRLEGLIPSFQQLYHSRRSPIDLAEYRVYWYSSEAFTKLDRDFFTGKRIGVLDDRVSHTHYLLPLTSLADYGVHQNEVELVYFATTEDLYEAFNHGEIQLVSSGDWLLSELDRKTYRSLITKDANVGSAFVRRGTAPEVECELSLALQPFYQQLVGLLNGAAPANRQSWISEACQ